MTIGSRLLKRIALVLLCAASPAIVHAQKQATPQLSKAAIEVAGTKLRLGMTKAQIAEKLVGHKITKLHEDEWMLGSLGKEPEVGPTLQFTHGLLSYAEREWTNTGNDTAEALFGAVGSLNGEGFSACTVTADTHNSPDMPAQRVWISCGEKSVLVVRTSIGQKSFTSIYEQLGRMTDWPD